MVSAISRSKAEENRFLISNSTGRDPHSVRK
jgi:hypothetical protein